MRKNHYGFRIDTLNGEAVARKIFDITCVRAER